MVRLLVIVVCVQRSRYPLFALQAKSRHEAPSPRANFLARAGVLEIELHN